MATFVASQAACRGLIDDMGWRLNVDLGTPVVEAIGAEATSHFTGRIHKVPGFQ